MIDVVESKRVRRGAESRSARWRNIGHSSRRQTKHRSRPICPVCWSSV